ncbi:Ig-like domain-containing protein [Ekhidna sp.]|uniref:Ig-like domain-containing protein n=2 Tax=Ekhidna sp. TaxID=2608089 RepID=UPI0032995B7E
MINIFFSPPKRVFILFILSLLITEHVYADNTRSDVPVITSEFCGQNLYTSILGTSSEPEGSIIHVYFRNSQFELATKLGSTTVQSDGSWRLNGLSLTSGLVSATATASGEVESFPTTEIEIALPPTISQGVLSHPTICGALDGSVQLLGLLPFTDYTIQYTDDTGFKSLSLTSDVAGAVTITGLGDGELQEIQALFKGCASNIICSVELNEPTIPKFTLGIPVQPLTCGGTGSILISGAPLSALDYDVSYYNGTNTVNATITSDAITGIITISGLAAGTYSNFQMSRNGCSSELIIDRVTLYDGLLPNTVTLGTITNPSSCTVADGAIQLLGLIQLTSYNVMYEDKDGLTTTTSISTGAGETSITLSGLAQGVYRNLRVESLGCISTPLSDVNLVGLASTINVGSIIDPINCLSSNGSIEISGLISGQSYDVDYQFDGTDQSASSTANSSGIIELSGLASGSYTNFFVSQGNCQSNILNDIVSLDEISVPEISLGVTQLPTLCGASDGEITLLGLLPGASYDVSYRNLSGVQTETIVSDAVTGNLVIENLSSDEYSDINVTINGCTSNTIVCEIDLNVIPSLTLGAVTPTTSCSNNDGSITLLGLQASTVYDISYLDSNGNQQLSNVSSSAGGVITLTNLAADTYSDLGVSLGGCDSEKLDDISIGSVLNISTDSSTPPTACGNSDGSIVLSGLSGSSNYDVTYTVDGTSTSVNLNSVSGFLTIPNLLAGSYTNILVNDGVCNSNTIFDLIELSPVGVPEISLGLAVNPTACATADGSISIAGLTASTLYEVSYTNSLGVQTTNLTSDALGVISITGLLADDYQDFSVTLAGCQSNILENIVSLEDIGAPSVSLGTITSPTVCSASDGAIELEGLLISTPYDVSFTLDGVGQTTSLTSNIDGEITIPNLTVGVYEGIKVTTGGCLSSSVGPVELACFEDAVYTILDQSIENLSDTDSLAYPTDADGPIVCAQIKSGSLPLGVSIDAETGVIYVSSQGDLIIGATTINVLTVDSKGDTTQQDVTIEILNDVPNAQDDLYTLDEGASISVNDADGSGGDPSVYGVIVNDSDIANSGLTVTKLSDPSHHDGAFTLNPDGTFVYSHNGTETSSDSFTYRLSDGLGESDDATVTITISPVNDLPTVTDINKNADEDVDIIFSKSDFVNAYSDPEDSLLAKVQILSLPPATDGLLKLNGSLVSENDEIDTAQLKNLIFEPVGDFDSNTSFGWNGSDGEAYAATSANVNITFNAINDAPEAVADNYTFDEGSTNNIDNSIGVLANDSDPDGDAITAILVTNVSNGSLTLNADGSFDYTHDGSESSSDTFTYKVNDGAVDGDTVQVTLTINEVNDAPNAEADSYSFDKGSDNSISAINGVLANDSDPEDDVLMAILIDGVSNGSLTLNTDGSFNYTHDDSETTTDSFSYKATDGTDDSDTVIVTLTIVETNLDLVTVPDTYTLDEGGNIDINASNGVLNNDEDNIGNGISAELVSDVSFGSLTLNADGSFTYVHDGSETTSDSFDYRTTNGSESGNTVTVTLNINPINDSPVANPDVYSFEEGSSNSVSIALGVLSNDSDPEGDNLDAILVSDVSNGMLTLRLDGSFDYVHDGSETTEDTFTYMVNDGTVDGNTTTVSITITAGNDIPLAVADSYTFEEGSSNMVDESAGVLANDSDPDGDEINAILVSGVTNGTLTLYANGSFDYVHDGSETSEDSFTYKVNDGTEDGNEVTVNITITPVNDIPVALPDSYSFDRGSSNNVSASSGVLSNDSDVDEDDLSAILVSDVTNGSLVLNSDGSFDYTHDNSATTSDSFTYKVNDGTVDGNTVTVSLTIIEVNSDLIAVSDSYTFDEGSSNSINAVDGVLSNDIDNVGSGITAVLVLDVSVGSLVLNADGSFNYTHDGSETSADGFQYRLTNGTDNGNTTTVTININPLNDPPVALEDEYSFNEGSSNSIDVANGVLNNDSDPDGDALSAILVSDVSNGTLALNADGSFDYDHDGSETLSDSFTYKVNDGSVDGNMVEAQITINPINDPPFAQDDSTIVDEGGVVQIAVTSNDSDPDGTLDLLSISIVQQPVNGSITNNSDGTIRYIHDDSETTSDSFIYTIDDNNGLTSNQATVIITINPVDDTPNEAPIANNDTITVSKGAMVLINVVSNDTDSDGSLDLGSITINSNPSNGALFDNGDGTITYTHDDSETLSDSFTYTINDDDGAASNIASVFITIDSEDLNDPPIANSDTVKVVEGAAVTINIAGNDLDVDGSLDLTSVTIISAPLNGMVTTSGNGFINYTHDDSDTMEDSFTYTINDDKGATSNIASVIIDIRPMIDVPDVFTPNDDGVNDTWVIPDIENYPNNVVKVFNRWGNEIITINQYNNTSNVWDSRSDGRLQVGSKRVPDGTYFYLIQLEPQRRPISGFVIVNR